ncbi:MAG: hypothetical protein K2I47_05630, partial [Odoribacter sp.]|nr:hypothetical protein [Odoribacter sp.]
LLQKKFKKIIRYTTTLNQVKEAGYETVKIKFSWERFTSEFNDYLWDVINKYEKNHHQDS